MATPNLGFLADLLGQLVYKAGVAMSTRRAWNFTGFTITDDASNARTNITPDHEWVADQASTSPSPVVGPTADIGTAVAGVSRADHVHALGISPLTSPDYTSVLLEYSAADVASGDATGLKINESTAGSGTTTPLDLQKGGTSHFKFQCTGAGGVVLEADDQLVVTADSHTCDLTPETMSVSEPGSALTRQIFMQLETVAEAADSVLSITPPAQTVGWVDVDAMFSDSGGPGDVASMKFTSSYRKGSTNVTIEGNSTPVTFGTDPDTAASCVASTGDIDVTVENITGSGTRKVFIKAVLHYVTP